MTNQSTAPLPITIIGGYLGAGKTTLVNHLLRQASQTEGLSLAVMVNEFGSLPIDADLIESQDENVISISGGCVCCSYGNDMIEGLMDLAQMQPRSDLVLLEASGVALPGSIRDAVGLLPSYINDGVVVIADAETVRSRAADTYMSDTVLNQLADADLLLLNKADLVDADTRADIQAWLSDRAENASVIATEHAALSLDIVTGLTADPKPIGHNHHHAHEADETFISVSIPMPDPVDAEALVTRLAELDLLRAKGFVRDISGQMMAIQTVGRRSAIRPASGTPQPGLVCIGLRETLDQRAIMIALED